MLCKSRTLSIVWKAVIFASATMGILLQCGVFSGKPDYSVLNYYTLMSNILCAVYYLPAALWACRKKGGTLLPQVKGTLVMCIIVTGMVYQFFLAGRFEMQGTLLLSNMLLHYVVPWMTVLDWILFDKKGYFKRYSPFLWVIAPVAYFIYVNIRVAGGAILGPYGDKYPYYFMDYDKLGVAPVIFINLGMAVFFLLLGYGIVGIDHLLAKRETRKEGKEKKM